MRPLTDYTDFRAYLSDWIAERKAQGLPGSNRWFAMKMAINSTSWLTSVIKGKKGLSKESAGKLSALFKHSPIEERYFAAMIAFNQARGIEDRNRLYRDLIALRALKEVRKVSPGHYDFYSTWYHSAVRSLVGMYQCTPAKESVARLAGMVSPPITPSQARKSIDLLVKLRFIRLNDRQVYELTSGAITSGEDTRSLGIANFQQETLRLAQEALDRFPATERYSGTVTVGVDEEAFLRIKKILIEASDRIAEVANAVPAADRVFHINLQAFPLSKKPKSCTIATGRST
jgi:uncharacterized protein (TIGR02147 family)